MKEYPKTIKAVDQYVNSKTPITFECLICENQWKARPNNIRQGRGCPECAIKSGKYKGNGKNQYKQETKVTHNSFIHQLKDRSLTCIDQYVNSKTAISFECNDCQHHWKATPNNILSGRGCPHCRIKLGEKLTEQWLNDNNILFDTQKTFKGLKDKYKLRVDFYIPQLNTIIEVDGEQHRRPIELFGGQSAFEGTQRRDQIKNKYCQDHEIKIIRLEYERMKLKNFTAELERLSVLL